MQIQMMLHLWTLMSAFLLSLSVAATLNNYKDNDNEVLKHPKNQTIHVAIWCLNSFFRLQLFSLYIEMIDFSLLFFCVLDAGDGECHQKY